MSNHIRIDRDSPSVQMSGRKVSVKTFPAGGPVESWDRTEYEQSFALENKLKGMAGAIASQGQHVTRRGTETAEVQDLPVAGNYNRLTGKDTLVGGEPVAMQAEAHADGHAWFRENYQIGEGRFNKETVKVFQQEGNGQFYYKTQLLVSPDGSRTVITTYSDDLSS